MTNLNVKTKNIRLDRKNFKRFISDIYYFYRFTRHGRDFELCLEPCLNGYDVGLYERYGIEGSYCLVFNKICLDEIGYENDIFGVKDRSDNTWNHALQVAEELLTKL